MRLQVFALVTLLVGAYAARAQDVPPDWDIARDPDRRLVTAAIPVTTGLGLVVRCSRAVMRR